MTDIVVRRIFKDDRGPTREKEDFTYTTFSDFQGKASKEPISFYRSDFRGASFSNCHFYKNNFDRADFISGIFRDCGFENVNIGASEIKNCYFYNTIFTGNQYNHTSIQESTFENCRFFDEHLLLNMKNCTLINCEIYSCTFERSTTESITFKNCKIYSTDMATMHAESHKFIGCSICDTSMGISYIFGYLFYNTDLGNIEILYRGEKVNLTLETMTCYANQLWGEQRYHEFLNINVLCGKIPELPDTVSHIFESILHESPCLRKLEISSVFSVLYFYVENNVIPYPVFTELLIRLERFSWKKFTSEERFIYLAGVEHLKLFIENGGYDKEFILSAINAHAVVSIHCNTDNYEIAQKSACEFLNSLCKHLGLASNFEVVDAQRGSWTLTFVVVAAVALLIPKIISESVNVYLEISTKIQINKHIQNELKKQDMSSAELKAITDIASDAGILKGTSFQITPSNLIDAVKINL